MFSKIDLSSSRFRTIRKMRYYEEVCPGLYQLMTSFYTRHLYKVYPILLVTIIIQSIRTDQSLRDGKISTPIPCQLHVRNNSKIHLKNNIPSLK